MSDGLGTKTQPFTVQPGELKKILQAFRGDILKDDDTKLLENIDGLVMELDLKCGKNQNGHKKVIPFTEQPSSKKGHGNLKERVPKEFVIRDSILTILWENPHLCAIYNLWASFYGLMCIYAAIYYYFDVQQFKKDTAIILWSWGGLDIVFVVWSAINLSIIFILYSAFRFWATTRPFVKNKGFFDSTMCILFILYEVALLVIPARIIIVYNIAPVSTFALAMEQIRLIMKSYAFVRENISRALKYKSHQDGDVKDSVTGPCPEVGKLIFFLFVPTLVYRDNYPRTHRIRWSFVAWKFLQFVGGLVVLFMPCTNFIMGAFHKTGIEPIPLVDFIRTLAFSVFAGGTLMLIVFNGLCHCWMNMFAEMLRFGDRMFYEDWWNSTSYAKYFRSWNGFVHDWLYSYVYQDMYFVLRRNRIGATLSVFMLSAIIHEYILALCFKFVFPFLFLMFSTFGVLLAFITPKRFSNFWNMFLWGTLSQGWGLMIVFYTIEWYSRINCPRIFDSWLDYVVPRSFHCLEISYAS